MECTSLRRSRLLWLALLLCLGTTLSAVSLPNQWFRFIGYDIAGERVAIRYEVDYGGVVELQVFQGAENERIYRNQYINRRGENVIYLKARAFEPGLTYVIQLDYKQETFRKELWIDP